MTLFKTNISIQANNKAEFETILKSLKTVLTKLSTTQFIRLTDVIENDPVKFNLAKAALGV
jgi:hypothetical protein